MEPGSISVHDRVDPEVAAALENFPMQAEMLARDALPMIRQMSAAMFEAAPSSEAVDHTDHVVDGAPDVAVRVYSPRDPAPGPRPCLYWMHAGGYIIGDYRMNESELDQWCEAFGGVAVSVDYRLAPEHPYPAPLDDCYAGLRWTWEHAEELGIDRERLGVGGASAGGGLAAALALLARDRGEVPLAFQFLLYPMLDDRGVTTSSQWDAPVWPASANRFGWECYLGDAAGGDIPTYAAAARATAVTGLPPTFVLVGSCDVLLDEDIEYAQRLLRDGVAAELHVYAGAPHGFDGLAPGTVLARRARHDVDDWFGRTLDAGLDERVGT